MIQVKPYIRELSRYAPPWSAIDRTMYLRMDLNENTQNPPLHVKEALKQFIDDNRIQMYPEDRRILPKLSEYAQVDAERLIVTNGSDQAIEMILRAFLGPGDSMVMAQPGFPIFEQVARVIGATIQAVSYPPDLIFPYEPFIKAITPATRLIVIINPDNPTGASVSLEQIQSILERAPDIPVIVDEAYFEYTGVTARAFLETHPNLIITRTFSKAFAMAGLRMGYIMAHPDVTAQFYKIRGPFDVNSCALVAAQAQLDHPEHWQSYIHETMNLSKPFIEKFFDEHGVTYYRGAAHFMLVEPKQRDRAVQYLKDHGILVRPMVAPLIQKTFRMNVGTRDQTRRFAEIYQQFLMSEP